MEISIDTSQLTPYNLNNQSTNKNKIEYDIHHSISNSIKAQGISKESLTMQIEIIVYHNFDNNSIVIYSKIIKNNQSRYSIMLNTFIIVFIEDISLIKAILAKVNSNIKEITINIDECLIIPLNSNNNHHHHNNINVKAFAYLLPSLIKLYVCIVSRHVYNKSNSILINAACSTQTMLLCKGLLILGYTPYYNKSYVEQCNGIPCSESIGVSLDDNETYNYIIDTTGKVLLNKRKLFSLLKYGGMFYGVNYNSGDYDNAQLIPEDFNIMQKKGIGICFISITDAIKYFVDYGKVINYCMEIMNKHIDENMIRCVDDNIKANVIDITKLDLKGMSLDASLNKGINLITFI